VLDRIRPYLRENYLDGWLLYDFRGQNPVALDVAGLQSSGTRRWFLWLPVEGSPRWLIHAIEQTTFAGAPEELRGEVLLYVGWQELAESLPKLLECNGRRLRIAMEYSPLGNLPYVSRVDAGTFELVSEVTGAEIVSSADLVQLVQAVLTPEQMESHRRAARHCLAVKDQALALVGQALADGRSLTEYDVQQFILERFAALELEPDHPPLVAVNRNAAIPHYAPSPQRHSPIRPGDMLLIDLWAKEPTPQACFADITWVAYCGSQVPEKAQEIFRVVAAARDAAVQAIQEALAAGRMLHGYEVDDMAREVIEKAGYGRGILHRTGHSLGPQIHWNGVNIDNLETQDRRKLIPGVMFTIEPGIYLPECDFDRSGQAKGLGIRSEINCIVHPDRLEITTLPLQKEIVPLL